MKKFIVATLVIAMNSVGFAATTLELIAKEYPEWTPSQSMYCNALAKYYRYSTDSIMSSYIVDLPLHIAVLPFEYGIRVDKILQPSNLPIQKWGISFQTQAFEKIDSDFARAYYLAKTDSRGTSVMIHFDKIEKYKTNVCVRIFK